MPARIAVANQKGGVGKTSVTLGLAAAASRRGDRALVIDLDPQANATTSLGVEPDEAALTVNDVLAVSRAGSLGDVIIPSAWPGVDVAPSTLDLSNRDLDGAHDLPFRLREGLQRVDTRRYAMVLIDCPPSVGRLLLTGLVTASHALLVTDATADGLRGIGNVESTVELVAKHMSPGLRIAGIVINRRRHTGEQDYREQELRDAFGDLVTDVVLPERAALPAAHAAAQPIGSTANEGARVLTSLFEDLYSDVLARTAPAGVAT